ncbi:hypothetical protein [Salinibacter ruber]|uniref:hypothetical protein n=1 Tax=Salinibacter ruber TaxID=146919 RepID=UPI0020732B65|nr:hypothetical protein [Salinibacter ruber]
MDFNVPAHKQKEVLDSALMGTTDISVDGDHHNVIICAQKKSASTFLLNFLGESLSYEVFGIGFDRGGGHLYYPRALAAKFQDNPTVSRCHEPAHWYTVDILDALNFDVIVLTRNLLDAIVSLCDHYSNYDCEYGVSEEMISSKSFGEFKNSNRQKKISIIIDTCARDYINFYMSWRDKVVKDRLNVSYVRYKEVSEKPEKVLKNLNTKKAKKSEPKKIISEGRANYNKGVKGRGNDISEKTYKRYRK